MTPDVSVLAQIAAQYGIPPALLYALGSYKSGFSDATIAAGVTDNTIGAFGITPDQLRSMGSQPGQVKGNFEAQAVMSAQLLSQMFQQYGSWDAAMSAYLTGDPQAYQSPTSPIGGQVAAILGIAGSRATYGLDQLGNTRVSSAFSSGSQAFQRVLQEQAKLGGVVTQDGVKSYSQASQAVVQAQRYQGSTAPQTEQFLSDVLAQAGLPVTADNLALLEVMAQGEGMPADDNNPLASTQAGQSVGTVPGTPGVQRYASRQAGVQATAATLLNGNFDGLLGAMRSGMTVNQMSTSSAVQQDLQRWQGGSTEDVSLLMGRAQSGAANTGGSQFGNNHISQGLAAASQNNSAGYSPGQCAWYAARSLGWVGGNWGNADQWAQRAADQGFQVNDTPAVGTAVVYGPGGSYSPKYGHVAVVTGVNTDGTFTVSEMNVAGQYVADERVSSMDGVIGFIHPPPGTDMTTAAPGLAQQMQSQSSAQPSQGGAQPSPAMQRQMAKATDDPTPAQVNEFAQQAQALHLDPGTIQQVMPQIAPMRRMLLEQGTQLGDLVPHVGLSPAESMQAIRDTPHPMAPNVSAGEMVDSFNTASLHSLYTMGRMPHVREAANFAAGGFSSKDMLAYYQNLSANAAGQPQDQPQAQAPTQTVDVQQLTQRQQDRGA